MSARVPWAFGDVAVGLADPQGDQGTGRGDGLFARAAAVALIPRRSLRWSTRSYSTNQPRQELSTVSSELWGVPELCAMFWKFSSCEVLADLGLPTGRLRWPVPLGALKLGQRVL